MGTARALAYLGWWLASWAATNACADDPHRPDGSPTTWKTEQLVTTDGKTHIGLIEAQTSAGVVFLELVQPPGRPLFAVRRPIAQDQIRSVERLSAEDRQAFQSRWERHLRRARVDQLRLEQIELKRVSAADQPPVLEYQSPWCVVRAPASEEVVRRTIVHL